MINDDDISQVRATVPCDRCGKELEHWAKNTQVLYCHVCGGRFCLECWKIQRNEENTSEGII